MFFNGIFQSSGYGYAGIFPFQLIAGLSNGAGLSGVVIGILRAFSLLVFPTDNNNPKDPNLFKGAILYFAISSGLCIFCLILFIFGLRTDYVNYHTFSKHTQKDDQLTDSYRSIGETLDMKYKVEEDPRLNASIAKTPTKPQDKKAEDASIITVHNKNWINLWGIFIVFASTFVVYPGVLLQANISFFDDIDWQIWFIIFIFTT